MNNNDISADWFTWGEPQPDSLEGQLRSVLAGHTYQSQVSGRSRGLMQHHIDALTKTLLPFIRKETEAYVQGEFVADEDDLIGITMNDADDLRLLRDLLEDQARGVARHRRAHYRKWGGVLGETTCRKYARRLDNLVGVQF